MRRIRAAAAILAVLLLLCACSGEKTPGSIDFGEGETDGTGETGTGVDAFTGGNEGSTGEEGEYETFFSVEEYDYTAETDSEIISYFGGDIGGALTRLAPSLKSVAYASYCYPQDMNGDPQDDILWCAIYSMVAIFRQYPEGTGTDEEGRVVIKGTEALRRMADDMFSADVEILGVPHEDFLDSLIYYDNSSDAYTFEPSGGEGLEIRICALEPGKDGRMNVTVQLYNSIFDFTSWVSLSIIREESSSYGYTVWSATSWSEEE
ncbi:MAG: hypothetical protein IKX85_02700 [Clostridia bacterium]|nr:hypothetical protein [Clostridia bacterium]